MPIENRSHGATGICYEKIFFHAHKYLFLGHQEMKTEHESDLEFSVHYQIRNTTVGLLALALARFMLAEALTPSNEDTKKRTIFNQGGRHKRRESSLE